MLKMMTPKLAFFVLLCISQPALSETSENQDISCPTIYSTSAEIQRHIKDCWSMRAIDMRGETGCGCDDFSIKVSNTPPISHQPRKLLEKTAVTFYFDESQTEHIFEFKTEQPKEINTAIFAHSESCDRFVASLYSEDGLIWYGGLNGQSVGSETNPYVFDHLIGAGKYKLVFNHPVLLDGKRCEITMRTDFEETLADPRMVELLQYVTRKGILNHIDWDRIRVGILDREIDNLSVVDEICKQLDLQPRENDFFSELSNSFSFRFFLRSITIPEEHNILYEKYIDEGFSDWIQTNLDKYTRDRDDFKQTYQRRDRLKMACKDGGRRSDFTSFLSSKQSIKVFFYYDIVNPDLNYFDTEKLEMSLRIAASNIFDVQIEQVYMKYKDENCTIRSIVSTNGETAGAAECMSSGSTYFATLSPEKIDSTALLIKGKINEINHALLEKTIYSLMGNKVNINWQSKLPALVRLSIHGSKGKILSSNKYWEKVDLTVSLGRLNNEYNLTIYADGYLATSVSTAPPEVNYTRPIEREDRNALNNFIVKLGAHLTNQSSSTFTLL